MQYMKGSLFGKILFIIKAPKTIELKRRTYI